MLALPLRLPTASYGGHMGHFLLSMLMLSGSAPFGNTLGLANPEPSVVHGAPVRRRDGDATRATRVLDNAL